MKSGNWNYTENIQYTVVLVKLLPVAQPPMHWQNCFAGQDRQVVKVVCKDGYTFYMDNQDGSGLLKISKKGGPDSYHASINEHEFIRELNENEWQQFDLLLHKKHRQECDDWQKKNFPNDYKKIEALKQSILDMRSKYK